MLITDVNRYQFDRTLTSTQHGLNGHRQRTGFWFEQAPGARTAALNKVFNRVATGEQFTEIFTEYRRIKFIALKGAADKERTQTAENRTGWPEIQIDTGGDVRRNQALMIKHVREQ